MQVDILVLNCGSSSVKFAIIDLASGTTEFSGIAENLGNDNAVIRYQQAGEKHQINLPAQASHQQALAEIQKTISTQCGAPVAVGHRVVHGGESFQEAVLITEDVKREIERCAVMAPLHNPANLMGIVSAQAAFPNLPHVAVFDTAFFQTMPETAYRYAIPQSLYQQHGIRRYGFHGSSHQFVAGKAAEHLHKPLEQSNFITAHLGNGCSVSAIHQGKAVDTSLGFTPLEGLVMGTRCGDIDPSLPGILCRLLNQDISEIDALLNKRSGLLGVSGLSNDCRTLEEAAQQGHEEAKLALSMFCYRLAKYIAGFMVASGPLDALVFTGGIGENSAFVRETTVTLLQHLGFSLDPQKNTAARFGASGNIADGGTAILVIPTNEEWVIASETQQLCQLSTAGGAAHV